MDKQIWMGRILIKQIRLNWILILILSFAFSVRIFNLATNPPELFSDEITHVLSARTIIETGHDINGSVNLYLYNRLKLGAPIYGYLAAFSTYIFRDNNAAIRLPAVFAGTLTVYLIYKLSLLITKDKKASLLTGLVTSVTPWNIYFSRIAWEPSLILPFILSGVLFFYQAAGSQKIHKIIMPYIVFAIAVYGADALEFLAPIFFFILVLLNFKKIWRNKYKHFFGLIVFTILLIPYIFVVSRNPLKYGRSVKISTFATGVNIKNAEVFTKNYLAHMSPVFLFEKGDSNLRHGTGSDGVIYWATLPFIIIGILYSVKNIKKGYCLFILLWLLIFPLGGSLTNDGVPHATRTLIGSPVFMILFAIGFSSILKLLKEERLTLLLKILFVLTIFLEFASFAKNYFIIYPLKSQLWWNYGQKETLETIKSISNGTESLCLTNIEYWHQDTYTNYYLGVGNKYKIIFDINDPACFSSEIIVVAPSVAVPSEYKLIKTVYSLERNPISNIYKTTTGGAF